MIIYHDEPKTLDVTAGLADLQAALDRTRPEQVEHDEVVRWLIELGELEAGVADALCPQTDEDLEVLQAWRAASLAMGALLEACWLARASQVPAALGRYAAALRQLRGWPQPPRVTVKIPEGYAHYSLYPSMYLESARRFGHANSPGRVIVIGLRSIGTSLSGVVGAALQAQGWQVWSCTLRPRGSPLDRRPRLAPGLRQRLRGWCSAQFAIVDEGPGLSGSSFCGTAQALSDLGVADDRIAFFASREVEPAQLRAEVARRRWPLHRHWVSSFEQVLLDSGQLIGQAPGNALVDLARGQWRPLVFEQPRDYPPVHPQHERRKYLYWTDERNLPALRRPRPAAAGAEPDGLPKAYLLKFIGLGGYGAAKLARAQDLAQAGFAPRPAGLRCGFLFTPFVPGRPLTTAATGPAVLERIAHYLAFVRQRFAGTRPPDFDGLLEMIEVNVGQGLGDEWAGRLAGLQAFRSRVQDRPAVALDGRMLPHEWLQTETGTLKLDALDHHCDHFFPGSQDMAWDLAGASLEFGLSAAAVQFLVGRYQALARDRGVRECWPFYRVAYLAFSLGYCAMAAETLGAAADGLKFAASREQYAESLRQELQELDGHAAPQPEHEGAPTTQLWPN